MKAWIPRNLRDDGMISMNEAPSYASFVQQYVLLSDHEQALAEKDLFIAQANRHKEELFAKLAEKEAELELANFTIKECLQKLTAMDKAHHQLMEKAIGLAKILMGASSEAEQYMTGEQFLKSPEVQAWKE